MRLRSANQRLNATMNFIKQFKYMKKCPIVTVTTSFVPDSESYVQ